MKVHRTKLALILLVVAAFIATIVLNITSDEAMYNVTLNEVSEWQQTSLMRSDGWKIFMNLVSMLFDPPICAAYLAIFWLISSRRL